MPLKFFSRLVPAALVALSAAHAVAAQSQPNNAPPKVEVSAAAAAADERAESVVKRAVEAVGGPAFLNVKTIVGRGNYAPYAKGVPGDIIQFLDYLVFPDRERTEFRSRGVRSIQTNVGTGADATGWVFDGMAKSLHDMRPEQIEDFRFSMRTSIYNLLLGWWRKEGATLTYLGRREAGLAKRNEAVRLTYPDGLMIDYEFGARDFLPAKVSYKRKNEEGEEQPEEDRYLRHMAVAGVTLPFVVDHYRAGVQTSRINYETIEFNQPTPDALFAKPASVKAVK